MKGVTVPRLSRDDTRALISHLEATARHPGSEVSEERLVSILKRLTQRLAQAEQNPEGQAYPPRHGRRNRSDGCKGDAAGSEFRVAPEWKPSLRS